MSWLQISFDVDSSEAELAADRLESAGASSVSFADAGDQPVLEPAPGETPLWPRIQVSALFPLATDPAHIDRSLNQPAPLNSRSGLCVTRLDDRDWEREWLRDFGPMRFGERLWVCPGDQLPQSGGGVVVRLDPGLAFGTGTHPTTALCLEWLDGADLDGRTVVDYGCGSGILGIAAALLGARRVIAIDNDPQALIATRDNARRNGVDQRVEVCPPAGLPAIEADVVLANILSGPLQALAPTLAAITRPGGDLVLSGLLAGQADEVAAAYESGFRPNTRTEDQGWVRLTACRRGRES
jgi:ribosomal protein L11 methyltransferase